MMNFWLVVLWVLFGCPWLHPIVSDNNCLACGEKIIYQHQEDRSEI